MQITEEANKLNILDISKPRYTQGTAGELNDLAKSWVELVLNILEYSQPEGLSSSGIVASPTVNLSEIQGKI